MRSNVHRYGGRINIYSPGMYLSYIIFNWKRTTNEKWTIQCGYVWRDKSCLYRSYGYVYFAYVLFLYRFHQKYIFFALLCFNPYISNIYIVDLNSRLPSPTICVTYLDYILLLLACEKFPLTSNMGGYFNMLEYYQTLFSWLSWVKNRLKYYLLFQNTTLGIWIFSQPIIDLKAKSRFYDVVTLYRTTLCTELHLL